MISFLVAIVCIAASIFLAFRADISDRFDTSYVPRTVGMQKLADKRELSHASLLETSASIIEDPAIGVICAPYDYSSPVPLCEPVDDSYFDRCVFIGDSRMLGLVRYNDISPINYCSVGFSLSAYENSSYIRIGEKNLSVSGALRENDDHDAIYIATGLNELGWQQTKFVKKYREMLKDIKSLSGDRPIYIQLILPMTSEFESSKKMNPYGLKNSDVSKFNESLISLAKELEVYYLDPCELFTLADGSLDPADSSDGAHLTLSAYAKQLEYYKTHVVM